MLKRVIYIILLLAPVAYGAKATPTENVPSLDSMDKSISAYEKMDAASDDFDHHVSDELRKSLDEALKDSQFYSFDLGQRALKITVSDLKMAAQNYAEHFHKCFTDYTPKDWLKRLEQKFGKDYLTTNQRNVLWAMADKYASNIKSCMSSAPNDFAFAEIKFRKFAQSYYALLEKGLSRSKKSKNTALAIKDLRTLNEALQVPSIGQSIWDPSDAVHRAKAQLVPADLKQAVSEDLELQKTFNVRAALKQMSAYFDRSEKTPSH